MRSRNSQAVGKDYCVARNKFMKEITMSELDTAHMFVQVIRNERHVLGYFSCADVWKYDERSIGGCASPFVKLLENKADALIASSLSENFIDWKDIPDMKAATNTSPITDMLEFAAYTMHTQGDLPITKLAYSMVYNDHHIFLKRLLCNPRVLSMWQKLEGFNYCDADGDNILDDGALFVGTTLLQEACVVDAFQSVRLLVNFRHQQKLYFNPFDTGGRENSRVLNLTQENFEEDASFIGSSTSNGMSAVHVACWHGNIRTLRVLLDAPMFDGKEQSFTRNSGDLGNPTLLPINRTNDANYGWQQSCCSAMGITPLHALLLGATESNQNVRDCVQILIGCGADVNVVSGPVSKKAPHTGDISEGNGGRQCYMTPLHLACLLGDPLLVEMLLASGALANAVSGHECLPFGSLFKPRDHCIQQTYGSMTPHRRCWTPTIMAVYALSIDPTSESRRAVAEITTAAMASLKTLQFPPPTNEYDQGDWNVDQGGWNGGLTDSQDNVIETNYPKWMQRVDRDCPNLLKMFKPVEDVKMQGTDDDEKEDEMSKLIGIVSTPAALPSQPLPDEWIAAFGSTSHSIDSTNSALPTLAASVRVILEERSIQVSDKVLNGVIRLVVNRMKSSASAVVSGSKSTVCASLIKHMFRTEECIAFFGTAPGKTSAEHDYGRYVGGPIVDLVSLLSCCDVTATATMSDATTYFRDIFQDLVVELFLDAQPFFACVKLKPGHPLLEEYREKINLVSERSIWYRIINDEDLLPLFFPSSTEQFVDFDFDSATPIEQTNFRKRVNSLMKHGVFLTNTNKHIADFHRKALLSCDFDDMVICFVENYNANELEAGMELHPFSNLTYGLSYSGIECAAIVDSFENEVNCLRDDDERIHDIERVKRVEMYIRGIYHEKYTSSETILLMVAYLQKVSQGLLTSGLLPTDGLKQRVLKLAELLQEIETIAKTPVVKDPEDDIPIEQIMLQLADLCQLRSEYSQALVLYQHVWEREDSKSAFSKFVNAAQYGIAEVHCHCGRLEEALAAFGRVSGVLEGK